jgi:hypothetical protein
MYRPATSVPTVSVKGADTESSFWAPGNCKVKPGLNPARARPQAGKDHLRNRIVIMVSHFRSHGRDIEVKTTVVFLIFISRFLEVARR